MTPGEFRLRVAYPKGGRLRWLSHLELVHALERSIRRAGMPYAVTQGFSPHMKVAFGPALPVGTASENEYLDVWLREYIEAGSLVKKLAEASVADLAPTRAAFVPLNAPSLTAALTIGLYRVDVDGREFGKAEMSAALATLIAAGQLAVEHKGKQKVFDLAQVVPKDAGVSDSESGVVIDLTLRMGPQGSLRPEMLVRAAAEEAGIEITAVRTTRLDTLVENDEEVWSRPL